MANRSLLTPGAIKYIGSNGESIDSLTKNDAISILQYISDDISKDDYEKRQRLDAVIAKASKCEVVNFSNTNSPNTNNSENNTLMYVGIGGAVLIGALLLLK